MALPGNWEHACFSVCNTPQTLIGLEYGPLRAHALGGLKLLTSNRWYTTQTVSTGSLWPPVVGCALTFAVLLFSSCATQGAWCGEWRKRCTKPPSAGVLKRNTDRGGRVPARTKNNEGTSSASSVPRTVPRASSLSRNLRHTRRASPKPGLPSVSDLKSSKKTRWT